MGKQTGAEGKPNDTLLIAEKVAIASKTGGTSIEDIAAADPTAIIKVPVDIMEGITKEQSTTMASQMGYTGSELEQASTLIANLYNVFISCDCTMLEINPLATLKDGRVLVCDSKVGFDDNAEFRQKDIFAQRDVSQENPIEVEAKKFDLNYIKLDGNVACMVNGAGLAMS